MTTTNPPRTDEPGPAATAPPGTIPAVVDGTRLPVAGAAVRQEVSFDSAGWRLAGHLHRPPGAAPGQRTAALAIAGPMTSVRETLPQYAQQVHDNATSADKELVRVTTHNQVELSDQDPHAGQALAAVIPFLTTHLAAGAAA